MKLSLRCHVVRIRPEITWLGELAIFDDENPDDSVHDDELPGDSVHDDEC